MIIIALNINVCFFSTLLVGQVGQESTFPKSIFICPYILFISSYQLTTKTTNLWQKCTTHSCRQQHVQLSASDMAHSFATYIIGPIGQARFASLMCHFTCPGQASNPCCWALMHCITATSTTQNNRKHYRINVPKKNKLKFITTDHKRKLKWKTGFKVDMVPLMLFLLLGASWFRKITFADLKYYLEIWKVWFHVI